MTFGRSAGLLGLCVLSAAAGELLGDQVHAHITGVAPRLIRRGDDGQLTILVPGLTVLPSILVAYRVGRSRPLVAMLVATALGATVPRQLDKLVRRFVRRNR
ncbi:MAG: hypothetical protein ACRDFS_01510 [Chloroflexota bacterium]